MDEDEERLLESPETPTGVTVPRRPAARDFSRTVLAHNVPLSTATDATWNEATFRRLLARDRVVVRLHEDPHQPGHRRLLADCPDAGAADTLKRRLGDAFEQLPTHSAKTFLDTMRQAEAAHVRSKAREDEGARRDKVANYVPVYDPESFHTAVEVTVRPSTLEDEGAFRRTFEQFGTIVAMEAAEQVGDGRTWRLTYAFLTEACAAEFAYHDRREDDRSYRVVIKNRKTYDSLLFLMAQPSDDAGASASSAAAAAAEPPRSGETSPKAVSEVSDGGCTMAYRLLMVCRWACCSGGVVISEPPTPVTEEARDITGDPPAPE